MNLLLSNLWPALALAVVLGLAAGWLAGLPRDRTRLTVAGVLMLVTVASGAVAVSQQVPGTLGLWVETASLMLAIYLAGCLLGALGRHVSMKFS